MRRFIEGWTGGAPLPRAIVDLQVVVEQFEGRVRAAGEEGAVEDDDLRHAARRAHADLSDETAGPSVSAHTFDRTRAREEMRRFQVRMTGCAGAGCLLALIWIGLSLLQINFVIEWIHANWIDNVWLSAVVGFVLAFMPIIGNLLAFLGATAAGWSTWIAALVFFAAPAATLLSGWSRWRRRS